MPLTLGYGMQPLRGIRLAATNEIRSNLELLTVIYRAVLSVRFSANAGNRELLLLG